MAARTDSPAPATVIYEERPLAFGHALAAREALWLEAGELARLTGWELKPGQGMCRGALCVAVAPGRAGEFSHSADGRSYINFAALADAAGRPWAGDLEHRVWYFGADAAAHGRALATLEAPDVELPDAGGRMHRLSEYRGRKVFLLTWASW
jgi:hypothetical protein